MKDTIEKAEEYVIAEAKNNTMTEEMKQFYEDLRMEQQEQM